MKTIDLRSDTVTQPCIVMRRAMSQAEVGDDVFGDDPTVNRLQQQTAEMAGHEAGLFMPSGTQSNLVGLLAHCQRGDEYIVGQQAHSYKYEAGGAAVLGSIQPQPIEFEADGTLGLDKVAAAIKPDDFHFARTRMLALENSVGGKVIPQQYIGEARRFTQERGLILHLDGAPHLMQRLRRVFHSKKSPVNLIVYLYAFQKAWARQWVQFCVVITPLSKRLKSGARWSAAGCVRPVF